ncbi:hypothetical protein B0H13DRAFT_2303685 [Mycena leptocephala]|nr:hypothetical protein B0H13DRAFT_2303685 [Mycena leptocephala]
MPGRKQSIWPNNVQYGFLQGLHAYWDAPFATHTVGRSGLNQFIVDYLEGLDIVRTKEQVASRMQVLRERMRKSADNHPVDDGAPLGSSFLSSINPQSPPKYVEILAIIDVQRSELSKSPPECISSGLPVAYKHSFIGMEEVEDEGDAPPLPSLPWNSRYILERESYFENF